MPRPAVLRSLLLLVVGAPPLVAPPAAAALPIPKGYVCARTATPIQIDGVIDEAEWKDAPWTDDFIDIQGPPQPLPRYRTRARMLWDDTYFYVAATLEEPHVWATFTAHDSPIWRADNDFEIFIDPNADSHEYYEFEINAQNTESDLFLPRPYKDGVSPLNSWEVPGLKTAVHVDGTLNDPSDTDLGWSVELAIPWAVLRQQAHRPTPPADGDQWRVNFSRGEWKHEVEGGRYRRRADLPEDNWVWSPQAVIDMHYPERWGYVQFSTAPGGTVAFRPDPTQAARDFLSAINYAQHEYRRVHGAWAPRLADLGIKVPPDLALVGKPRLETTTSLFQASVILKGPNGRAQRLSIRQDSLIWTE
jgi:Carbohydrate family 9 binding domain-like